MDLILRRPNEHDGYKLHKLVERAGKLDTNSIYCNLLQLSHFADTAIVAEVDDRLVGSITGYRLPTNPNTLFVWQVAVDPDCRGQGLASKMLKALAERLIDEGVTHIETTITQDNMASRKLFTRFFEKAGTSFTSEPYFESEAHFQRKADTEYLYRSDLSQLAS
jgi:L-2,4-diaminobutyric acid acetyltransferase